MRPSIITFVLFTAATSFASPSPLAKRASITDKATIGFATLNGGTTGGGPAAPVTVTTLDAFQKAVSGDLAKVVLISGTIQGATTVKVGSNTSVIGKSGAGEICFSPSTGNKHKLTAKWVIVLEGVGISIGAVSNVIVRNVKISKVLAEHGDAIGIASSNRVWIDHVEVFSDRDHDKDYYDGLIDVTKGSYGVSITYSYLHYHYKTSLVGASDSFSGGSKETLKVNDAVKCFGTFWHPKFWYVYSAKSLEDTDKALRVTYAFNNWANLGSRTPSFRFGKGHIYNN
ncbi:unnamed protein product, partial [Rhizoctonia solani]